MKPTPEGRLEVLDELGRRLETAAAASTSRRRRPRRRWTLALVVAGAVAVVAAGAAVGSGILHDDEPPPARTSVSVLNATTAPGVAASAWQEHLAGLGYELGVIGNYPELLRRSRVVYRHGHRGAALRIAGRLRIGLVRELTPDEGRGPLAVASAGSVVVVVVGRDSVESSSRR
jgi:hypothetical protein